MDNYPLSVNHVSPELIVPRGEFLPSTDYDQAGCSGVDSHKSKTAFLFGSPGIVPVVHKPSPPIPNLPYSVIEFLPWETVFSFDEASGGLYLHEVPLDSDGAHFRN